MIGLKRVQTFSCSIALAILTLSPCVAQEAKRPTLNGPAVADSAAHLVPEGWRFEAERLREADLNGDGRPDAAFVISHGGSESPGAEDASVKHVLVLAFKGSDGKLHRSIVSDAAVLDGDEGGVFGDPFEDFSVERGVVVISHYGGSRERWGFTHRYRFQNGKWTLIGLNMGNTDTLDLEHYDNQDINLSTGLVNASEKGSYENQPQKPERSGSYYELEVSPIAKAPAIDGQVYPGEWPGYFLRLSDRQQVYRNRRAWRGREDVSALIRSARVGEELFLCVEVFDDEVTPRDAVRLVTKRGLVIKPRESKTMSILATLDPDPVLFPPDPRQLQSDEPKSKSSGGYVFEARYSLKGIAKATVRDDKYAVENLEMLLDPSTNFGDLQGFQLPASVEVIDVDRSVPRIGGVLSTRLAGSPFPGAIRLFRKGTLILESDVQN